MGSYWQTKDGFKGPKKDEENLLQTTTNAGIYQMLEKYYHAYEKNVSHLS